MLHLHSYTHSARMCWVYVCAQSPLTLKLILSHFCLPLPLGCVCVWVQASLSTFGRLAGGWKKLFAWDIFHEGFVFEGGGGSNMPSWETCLRDHMLSAHKCSLGWISRERPPVGIKVLQFPGDKAQPRAEERTYLLYLCTEYREI